MLDLRDHKDSPWDKSLKPLGYGEFNKESFDAWWGRHHSKLSHLSPEICEQWIYRHWTHSPLHFIQLNELRWHEEVWAPHACISKVRVWRGNDEELNPNFDYKAFHAFPGNVTAKTLDAGKWEYAPILLPTPGGFIDTVGEFVDAEYLLVEGHQRRRYLNAILAFGRDVDPQRVLILDGWP